MEGRAPAGVTAPALGGEAEPRSPLMSETALLCLRTTRPSQILDLTHRVEAFVEGVGLATGFVNVQSRHTTTGLLVNEDEPLLLQDLTRLLERLAPRAAGYAHDELHRRENVPPDERPNGHSHARAALLQSSETLNVVGGSLHLGRWQRILLFELDGPRRREISLVGLGQARR